MAEKARHAFGALENVDSALSNGLVDAYDILFLKDANNIPHIGWIDKHGNKVIVEDKIQVVRIDKLPTTNGDSNVIYIYNNEGYIWNGTECVPLAKTADLTALENQVSDLESQLETKVDEATIDAKIKAAVGEATSGEVVEF